MALCWKDLGIGQDETIVRDLAAHKKQDQAKNALI